MGFKVAAEWMPAALTAGTTATTLWRGVRDESGTLIDLEVVECDVGAEAWFGLPREALIGHRYSRLVPTGVHERLPLYLEAIADGAPRHVLFRRVVGEQHVIDAEVRIVPCGNDLLFAQTWDVTDREMHARSAEEARLATQLTLDQLEAALNVSPDGFAIYAVERGGDDRITTVRMAFVNEVAAQPTGRPPESWRGVTLEEWFPEAVETGLRQRIVDVVNSQRGQRFVVSTESVHGWSGQFENILTPFGLDMALITWHPVKTSSGAPLEVDAAVDETIVRGIDALTGLPGRAEFLHRLTSCGGGTLLMVDIDDFRRLNALVGRHGGDLVLNHFAQGLREAVPAGSLIGRTGPDEFGIHLEAPAGSDIVAEVGMKMHDYLKRLASSIRVPTIEFSGGWAPLESATELDEALLNAELALRSSVDFGGHCVTAYSADVRSHMLSRALQARDLLDGLSLGQFVVAYQPIVQLRDRTPRGAEGLVRWNSPQSGLLGPGAFIGVAERTGTIVELGAWILDTVVGHLAVSPTLLRASINVSGVQLMNTDVAAQLAASLESHRVDASRVAIEITESEFIPASTRIDAQLQEMRAMGARIAIDDFGSGFSSLAYLDRIPVDVVKLDARFLAGDITNKRERLVTSVAAMIDSIGATSLIEGVETEAQWRLAMNAGVVLGQGYLFGMPEIPQPT